MPGVNKIFVLLVLAIFGLASCAPATKAEIKKLENEFLELYEESWMSKKSGIAMPAEKAKRLEGILNEYRMPTEYQGMNILYLPEPYIEVTCTVCHFAINTVLKKYNSGASRDELVEYVVGLCKNLNIQTEPVCRGAVELNVDPILYIMNHTKIEVTSERWCGVLLQTQCTLEDDIFEWSIDLTPYGEKPAVKPFVPKEDKLLKVVQLTDIHYDPKYEVGGNAVCKEPLCCRIGQGPPTSEEAVAGYWGDYRSCDVPWHVVQSMFESAATVHKDLDYVIMTGDLIDHGVWATTVEGNKAIIKKFAEEMKRQFGDTPVFPILGNHESSPLDVFAPVNIEDEIASTKWVYETAASAWSPWLSKEAQESILKGGYYTALAKPGLRIVALHNIVCYVFNWWLLYNPSDQDGQLKWLADTLAEAEKNNEKVHIIAHVPSGSRDCFKVWSREYRRIVNRFENTVVAQFTGHTHREEFHLYYDHEEPTRATSISYVGGSGTSFSNVNPNYRVYYIDGSESDPTWAVVDYETWSYNMTDANLHQNSTEKLHWFKMYSFRETYGLDHLTVDRVEKLTHEMLEDESLLHKYFRYYVTEGDPFLAQGCDTKCLQDLLCEIVTNQPDDLTQCNQLGLTRSSAKLVAN